MYNCSKCDFKTETAINFCPQCGNAMVLMQPVAAPTAPLTQEIPAQPAEPVNTQPVQPAYTQQAQPTYTQPAQPAYTQQAQPTYTQPTEPAYTGYTQQAYYQPVTEQKVPLGLKITGMVLSIVGLMFAFFTFIGTVESFDYGDAFSGAFVLTLFFGALPIVGLVMSNKCRNDGDTSAFSKVGKILGIVGIALFGFCLFLGLVSLL